MRICVHVFMMMFLLVTAKWMSGGSKMTYCCAYGNTSNPLFLTPYVEAGRIDQGRQAAKVPPLLYNIESYSGYLTVNENYQSNMFFWYFPAENRAQSAPVALWLQGGPGESSLSGLFFETGPLSINTDSTVSSRNYSWTKDIHMIYIDNPVGTGFSFTRNDAGYVTDQEAVGRDLYAALIQFFQLFPELQSHDFFITGESYAGKYIPALGYTIHSKNPTATLKIKLKGIAIGNGLIDPVHMMKYGNYLVQLGLIDEKGLQHFLELEANIEKAIHSEQYLQATTMFGELFRLLIKEAGHVNVYDYLLQGNSHIRDETLRKFLSQAHVRKRIHVGGLPFNDEDAVQTHLMLDEMKSVKPWFQILLEHYRILLYNGQLDIAVAYPLTVNFIENLQWSGSSEYSTAERKKWFVGGDLAGYSKSVGNFTELLVLGAGHMVPSDQPERALNLIRKLMFNIPF